LVERFIETKSGSVELTDNETSAAEVRRARFFIYWIGFYSGSRSFTELTIVSDPLAHRGAIKARFVLDGRSRGPGDLSAHPDR
jgi:hypothetical protein